MTALKTQTASAQYRERIKVLKPKLKQMGGYRRPLIEKYPEYNNLDGLDLISRVLNFRSTDMLLADRLEQIVQEWELSQAINKDQIL